MTYQHSSGIKLFNEMKAYAQELGIEVPRGTKMAELAEMIEQAEAKMATAETIVVENLPLAELAAIPAQVEGGISQAEANIEEAEAELQMIAEGRQALQTLARLGLFIDNLAPDAAEQLTARASHAQMSHINAAVENSRLHSVAKAYAQLRESLQILGLHGYENARAILEGLPDFSDEFESENIGTTATYRWHFVLTGHYRADAVVEGFTLEEAKANLKEGKTVGGNWTPYNSWCTNGREVFWKGVRLVTPDQPQTSHEYASTLTVTRLEAETPQTTATGRLFRYDFVLDGTTYEGRASVIATNLEQAKAKLLAGDIIAGDDPRNAEWGERGDQIFQFALKALGDDTRQVSTAGHTLSYQRHDRR